ncbi:hypothetical protein AXG93_441s1170 [Marchantia polymorpha subsp. ruderalis]|uniref:Uncharacterized protein n=1 Tax=Marchantia polymorpha subsp. ruderalis TaxID=1480154 RepID=A0A176W575_MARPO|nr:hypothetical protein AXG93_441s1170 [Marchantia polymorpha subsp. ruderalis]
MNRCAVQFNHVRFSMPEDGRAGLGDTARARRKSDVVTMPNGVNHSGARMPALVNAKHIDAIEPSIRDSRFAHARHMLSDWNSCRRVNLSPRESYTGTLLSDVRSMRCPESSLFLHGPLPDAQFDARVLRESSLLNNIVEARLAPSTHSDEIPTGGIQELFFFVGDKSVEPSGIENE